MFGSRVGRHKAAPTAAAAAPAATAHHGTVDPAHPAAGRKYARNSIKADIIVGREGIVSRSQTG